MNEPYAAQDALIDAALAAGEKDDGAVKTCPKCRYCGHDMALHKPRCPAGSVHDTRYIKILLAIRAEMDRQEMEDRRTVGGFGSNYDLLKIASAVAAELGEADG